MENHHFEQVIQLQIAIFNSSVTLPESISTISMAMFNSNSFYDYQQLNLSHPFDVWELARPRLPRPSSLSLDPVGPWKTTKIPGRWSFIAGKSRNHESKQ